MRALIAAATLAFVPIAADATSDRAASVAPAVSGLAVATTPADARAAIVAATERRAARRRLPQRE